MDKNTQSKRQKRVRLSTPNGVASPRIPKTNLFGQRIGRSDESYANADAMAKDFTPKVQRVGNFYKKVTHFVQGADKGAGNTYSKLVSVNKNDYTPTTGPNDSVWGRLRSFFGAA